MSEENVEIARQAAEAMSRRDRATWLALHEEDFEVVAVDDWPEAGVRGAEAAWDFYETIFDAFERVTGSGGSGYGETQQADAGADKVLIHHRPELSGGGGAEVEICPRSRRAVGVVRNRCFGRKAVVP
jgi:ketosteroid isomerase-like protein